MSKKVTAIDIEQEVVQSCGTAYIRLTPELKDFLQKCHRKHGIAGFEWEEGSWNFGVILEKEVK